MRIVLLATALLLTLLAVASAAEARPLPPLEPQTCVGQPGAAAVCYTNGIAGPCVSAGVGLQGGSVCKRADGLRVCTSARTAVWGYCPTDLVGT